MKKTPRALKRYAVVLNIFLFSTFAIYGYLQYYFRQAPPERSLHIGIAFTIILPFYIFLVKQRSK